MPSDEFPTNNRDAMVSLIRRLLTEFQASSSETWANQRLDQYLEALGAWLEDCEGYYASLRRGIPTDPWEILADALQAARSYE